MEDTKFSLNQTPISTILAWVESGAIAIPEIQRPFVWTSTQVRDLMDSLYQGYPVGYIITWQNPDIKLKDGTTSQGKRILIDGQQRITALSAAISGLNVVDKRYKKCRIAISFNPLTEEFRTRTSSTERGKEWISDIAEVMVNGYDTLTFVDEYVARNPGTTRQKVNARLNRLIQIKNKQIGEIQLNPSLDINISVSDLAPREYLGDILSGNNNHHSDIVNEAEMVNNFEDNAVPKILLQAEADDYDEFLRQRQRLMAEMVRDYYKGL